MVATAIAQDGAHRQSGLATADHDGVVALFHEPATETALERDASSMAEAT